jgi:hypothetical protein
MGRYFVTCRVDREMLGEAIATDDSGKISTFDWHSIANGGQIGPDFACLGEAEAYADGLALNCLLTGSFVKSTAWFVYDRTAVEDGGFISWYWVHGRRIANRVGERLAEILRG